jgi:hypothetical protein
MLPRIRRSGFNTYGTKKLCPMTETPSKKQILLARIVIALLTILILLGLIEYASSPSERRQLWQDILARPGGPMTFRFLLQPAMAAIAALRDGIKDARAKRSPYLWTIFSNRTERAGRLYEGLISTAQIILLGLVMDGIYQLIVLKTFYPGQAVIIALLLGFCPYLLLRGPVARVVRWWRGDAPVEVDPVTERQQHDR